MAYKMIKYYYYYFREPSLETARVVQTPYLTPDVWVQYQQNEGHSSYLLWKCPDIISTRCSIPMDNGKLAAPANEQNTNNTRPSKHSTVSNYTNNVARYTRPKIWWDGKLYLKRYFCPSWKEPFCLMFLKSFRCRHVSFVFFVLLRYQWRYVKVRCLWKVITNYNWNIYWYISYWEYCIESSANSKHNAMAFSSNLTLFS